MSYPSPVFSGGDAEVGELGPSFGVEQHIVGLDVSVDDPVGVSVSESLSYLAGYLAGVMRIQLARLPYEFTQ